MPFSSVLLLALLAATIGGVCTAGSDLKRGVVFREALYSGVAVLLILCTCLPAFISAVVVLVSGRLPLWY